MRHSLQELFDIVYRFYPRGIWPDDPQYPKREEGRRFKETCHQAYANYGPWRAMLGRLGARFPDCRVRDEAMHLASGGCALSYDAKLVLPTLTCEQGEHALGFLVSIVVPYYVIYGRVFFYFKDDSYGDKATLPGIRLELSSIEQPYARGLAQELEATFPGYEPMPPDIGKVVVPDVCTNIRGMGEATLYDCLLADLW
jgi:hypothetical protein